VIFKVMSVPPGWSVPVRLEDIPETGLRFTLAADAAAVTLLARAAGVEAVTRLEADFDVSRYGRDGLTITGRVSATVRQACVVTMEPVEKHIEEPVDLTFMPYRDGSGTSTPEEAPNVDPPDVLVDGTVDLGAIATEFLILGIDPYPRKAGAVFAPPATGEEADQPFAALAALKKPP
jgi:uncharacterized metal-binding protein YceD (DUF177 family)